MYKYNIAHTGGDHYALGDKKDIDARIALRHVHQLVRQRSDLQNQLFQAQSAA